MEKRRQSLALSSTKYAFSKTSGTIQGLFSPIAKIEKIEVCFDKSAPIFSSEETVSGSIHLIFSPSTSQFIHGGIEIQMRGYVRVFYVNTVYQFLYSNFVAKSIAKSNEPHVEDLSHGEKSISLPFKFENVSKPIESYQSNMSDSLFCISYDINICIYPPTGVNANPIMHHQDFLVHSPISPSSPATANTQSNESSGIKLLCTAQNILELEITFLKLQYSRRDMITGSIQLLSIQQNTEIVYIELHIIRRETIHASDFSLKNTMSKRRSNSTSSTRSTNSISFNSSLSDNALQNSVSTSTNLAKFEILDGNLPLCVQIPFRFPLLSLKNITSSIDIPDKVSLKYYANILIETSTNKRLYKQQEIVIL